MIISASHHQYETYKNKIQEVRYPSNMLNSILNYLNNPNHTQTILIEITTIENMEQLEKISLNMLIKLYNENPQIKLSFSRLEDLKTFSTKVENHRYMYAYPINTWAFAEVVCRMGVSDVFLGEPLVFDMNAAKALKDKYNVNIRVCPHIGSPTYGLGITNELNHFFVLPHHMKLYKDIIDVIDIRDRNVLREATLIDLYSKEKEYTLPLNLLVENVQNNAPGSYITKELAKKRMNCKQICLRPDRTCHSCDMYIRALNTLKNHSEP